MLCAQYNKYVCGKINLFSTRNLTKKNHWKKKCVLPLISHMDNPSDTVSLIFLK